MKSAIFWLVSIIGKLASCITGGTMLGVDIVLGGQSIQPANFWLLTLFFIGYAVFYELRKKKLSPVSDAVTSSADKLKKACEALLVSGIAAALAVIPVGSAPTAPLPYGYSDRRSTPQAPVNDRVRLVPIRFYPSEHGKCTPSKFHRRKTSATRSSHGLPPISFRSRSQDALLTGGEGEGLFLVESSMELSRSGLQTSREVSKPQPYALVEHRQTLHPAPCPTCSGDVDTDFTTKLPDAAVKSKEATTSPHQEN